MDALVERVSYPVGRMFPAAMSWSFIQPTHGPWGPRRERCGSPKRRWPDQPTHDRQRAAGGSAMIIRKLRSRRQRSNSVDASRLDLCHALPRVRRCTHLVGWPTVASRTHVAGWPAVGRAVQRSCTDRMCARGSALRTNVVRSNDPLRDKNNGAPAGPTRARKSFVSAMASGASGSDQAAWSFGAQQHTQPMAAILWSRRHGLHSRPAHL